MSRASVRLSAYNTGFETEAEFDAWIAYVAARIDEVSGLDVSVDSYAFTGRGAGGASDDVDGTDEEVEAIRAALSQLWDDGCADSFVVPAAEVAS